MNHISINQLKKLMEYDSKTGVLKWRSRPASLFRSSAECKRWNSRYAGKAAFSKNSNGYLDGYIMRERPKSIMYRAHRVAWAMHYGRWPKGEIDHINGYRGDNRISNLRECTRKENTRNQRIRSNNKSGATGVIAHKSKWRAYIFVDGKSVHLGIFSKKSDAIAARKKADAENGYHKNHGDRHGVEWSEPHPDERSAA